MARVDKNSSIKPFFDDSAEGINQLPAFLTAPKNPNILEKVVEETTQETVETVDETKFESAGDDEVIKVDLSKPIKKEEDATGKQSTDEVPVRDESEASKEVREENEEKLEESTEQSEEKKEEIVLEEITEDSTEEEITYSQADIES